mmetsp:Transcript_8399/g.23279  ORF Transcript_8399/g.23279 Transcript_8399/m.23279 type:complete len:366 (+) Transcript_8399:105-1202(+)|eukprot:CAMPEP_0168784584 /NCGR_PEP_ID=MMETSP0725-20121227/10297_1 /TAXON_ID=265536 /ORGANISM="Amphiprora sp., Strain CCMP467" /LENGTH=365 /DNA_ID=CAMNT_0008834637 /DNA_START=64 /DNA_END=1161 /DNA_ORIENTATION=-
MAVNWDAIIEWVGIILLFCLVFGMSATVDIKQLQQQLGNKEAILTGLFLQFIILPLIGFWVVVTFQLDRATGITLLVVTTSPGGSYSNWWCSMFNGDLALSVAMTAISTLASTIMMPLNLYVYSKYSFDDDILETLEWGSLIFALFVVVSAIAMGLLTSACFREPDFNLRMNQLGNFAGVSLVLFSAAMSNADKDARIYNREWQFYVGVALPCILGLICANLMTTGLGLEKPERVTVSIECCYQNVGIATSVALKMFDGGDQAKAVAVPFYYGSVEAVVLLIYCIGAWRAGWTKAPKNTNFFKMIATSYEVIHANKGDIDPDYQAYMEHQSSPHHPSSPDSHSAHTSPTAAELITQNRYREFSPA